MNKTTPVGAIVSADVTVSNAEEVRDFYQKVLGWQVEELQMSDENGEYADYVMKDANGTWAAGVCHKRGMNVDLPKQWIVYVNVADVQQSVNACKESGGKVLKEMSHEGKLVYALIEDPAGCVLAVTKTE